MYKVAVLGPTGYSGLELLKILLAHPQVEISALAGRRSGAPRIDEIFPSLVRQTELVVEELTADQLARRADCVILAVTDRVSQEFVPQLMKQGTRAVVIPGDYRLRDAKLYEEFYGYVHKDPENLGRSVYGLTELWREQIAKAELVANPGCYAVASLLALAPAAKQGIVGEDSVIIDAKSGISGAGKQPTETTHFVSRSDNVDAYRIGTHKHQPEIEQCLGEFTGDRWQVLFVPHRVPMDRGILASVYLELKERLSIDRVLELYQEFYAREPFVRVRRKGGLPATKEVMGTNYCDIGLVVVRDRLVVVSCIDNLVKGASGQAVQNMNVMLGLPETAGLT
jgi:N-acetyl-gamma-glutamyl-phosphate reductase